MASTPPPNVKRHVRRICQRLDVLARLRPAALSCVESVITSGIAVALDRLGVGAAEPLPLPFDAPAPPALPPRHPVRNRGRRALAAVGHVVVALAMAVG